jgi:hypothetical protein
MTRVRKPTPQTPTNPFGLTHTQRRIFDYIAIHPYCTRNDIIPAIYSRSYDGGPAFSNLSTNLVRIRRKLFGGVRIISTRGPSANYHLEEPSV